MSNDEPAADGQIIDAIVETLKYRHQKRVEDDWSKSEQAITSSELADEITDEDAEANPATREAVKDIMEYRGLPIRGDHDGYYIPVLQEEIDDAIAELDSRIAGIQERKQLLADNWENWQQRQAMADGVEADGGPRELTDEEREFVENNPISEDELLETRRGGEA